MALSNRLLVSSTIVLLVIGFLALLSIVGMTFWLGQRAGIYFDNAIEARDTRGAAVELRYAIQTAESSQRGYLVSGNQIYLAPYGTAKSLAERQLALLRQRLASRPESQALLQRLTALVGEKFAEMDQSIELKRDRRDEEAIALFRTNRGKALSDEANVFFGGIIRAADERLTEGVGEQRENAALLRLATIAGGVLIVFVVGIVVLTVLRYTRELAAARDEVAVLNTGLERRVAERTAELSRANDEIQRFAYVVTHDLRAPLVNIMGFTSELERSIGVLREEMDRTAGATEPADRAAKDAHLAVTVDLPEAIDYIRSSTRKMDGLINAILKLSREGRRKLRAEPVDLPELVAANAAAIQHQVAEAGGEIALDLKVPRLFTDRLSLEQIFGNLFDNAVKYRSKDRPLKVMVSARPLPGRDRIMVEFADNGRGIGEQDRERVFEMFRRAGAQDQPGEGIGLAHVRSMVRNLGGEIALDSALGRGTTFRLTLPIHLQVLESAAT